MTSRPFDDDAESTATRTSVEQDQPRRSVGDLVANLILAVLALSVIVPFVWSALSSFQTNADFVSSRGFLPNEWTIENYVKVFTEIPMARMILNGVFIAGTAAVGGVFASSLAAFCLAKIDFRGRGPLLMVTIVTMMVPAAVLLIPLYTIINALRLVDTPWALILPHLTGSAFAVFFLRQHMMSVPHELFEAATLDGCSVPGILFRIYLPLARGPISVLIILNFMMFWNDLLGPLIYLNSAENMTPTAGLSYFRGQYVTEFPVLLAGSMICIIPTTIIFILFSNQIKQGVLITGLK